jgi:hypothetical protein
MRRRCVCVIGADTCAVCRIPCAVCRMPWSYLKLGRPIKASSSFRRGDPLASTILKFAFNFPSNGSNVAELPVAMLLIAAVWQRRSESSEMSKIGWGITHAELLRLRPNTRERMHLLQALRSISRSMRVQKTSKTPAKSA